MSYALLSQEGLLKTLAVKVYSTDIRDIYVYLEIWGGYD